MKNAHSFLNVLAALVLVIWIPSNLMAEDRSVGGFLMAGSLDANQGYHLTQLGGTIGVVLVEGLNENSPAEYSLSYSRFAVSKDNRLMRPDSTFIKKVTITEATMGGRIVIWEIFSLPVGLGIARVHEKRVKYVPKLYLGLLASVEEGDWNIDVGLYNAWYPDRPGRDEDEGKFKGGKYPPRNTMVYIAVRRNR